MESRSIVCVVGARPNYMKMAPLLKALRRDTGFPRSVLVHTGQHYDELMYGRLFSDLNLPPADINLEVGSGTHAVQTAEVMRRFEPVLDAHKPHCVIVVGDVNSTLACALVAVKKQVPIVHVEAGLRSFDRTMPEEVNRVLTDQISDLLFTTERSAHENLAREGIEDARVRFVGNLMIDSLLSTKPRTPGLSQILPKDVSAAGEIREQVVCGKPFAVVTLHRPSNVDDPSSLQRAVSIMNDVSRKVPIVWPMHPRTRANLSRFGFDEHLDAQRVLVLPPQGYLEMVGLLSRAAIVLTDSGGVQEESTALSVPCLTLRENTERPVTVAQGTNSVVGLSRERVLGLVDEILQTGGKRGRQPELWDGHAADRIAVHLKQWLGLGVSQDAAKLKTA